jgi:hypothetical protein
MPVSLPSRLTVLRPRAACARLATLGLGVGSALALLAACDGGGKTVGPGGGTGARAPSVGDILRLNTNTESACDTTTAGFRSGRVVAVGDRAVIVADTRNPAGGFTDEEYRSFAAAFDTLVYPVDVANFGEPTDLDENGRSIIFFTSAVNAETPRGADYIVGGFFWERDLFPKTGNGACRGSNDAEMFYMLVPDPNGTVNGNTRTKAYAQRVTVSTLGHEFQHLINASRRLYVTQTTTREEVWLNEGLSHVAEELLYFRASGLAPRRNVTITDVRGATGGTTTFNQYQVQNANRFATYLRTVERASPYADDDSLQTRGATWDFLRYAADRRGGSEPAFWQALVNTNLRGMRNLQSALGASASVRDWFRDWAVSNYTDDQVSGVEPAFLKQSWDQRSVLSALSGYPLPVRALVEGVPQRVDTLPGGGAAYFAFTVPTGVSATLRTRALGGGTVPPALRLSVVRVTNDATNQTPSAARVTTFPEGQGADITVRGNTSSDASFVLVAFHADTNPAARATFTVTGSSLAALASRLSQPGPTLARLEGAEAALAGPELTDAPLLRRLNRIAERELTARMPAARAAYAARLRERAEGDGSAFR